MSSASTLYRLLQYWFMSILCFVIRHDVIKNESLKPHYFFDDHMRTWKTAKEGHLKADTFWKVHFKMWRILKKLIWFLTHCSMLTSKSEALSFCNFKIWRVGISHFKIWHVTKFLFQNDAFYKAWTLKNMSFSRSKKTKTWFCECKNFFSIWHFERLFSRNLTRRIFFNPKSDALWNFYINMWRVRKF